MPVNTSKANSKFNLNALWFLLVLFAAGISFGDEDDWFKGGTLHKATVSEWRQASTENKLATVSDWLAATLWKGHLTTPQAFKKLKKKSEMLVNAVDNVAESEGIGSMKVIEIAASIVTISNDLGPNQFKTIYDRALLEKKSSA